ncbi:MAG TPA: TonB-dependent receptor [Candidatus Acidoferrales bacterium]|nr:TonB-dependent receptor [Candidatus Acidoferrales bacterium]
MRVRRFAIVFFVFFIAVQLFAADLKVRVLDPSSSAVAGARVSLLSADGRVVAVATSNNFGTATFANSGSAVRVQVLAPGFAPLELAATSAETELTAKLRLAPQAETVQVTADAAALPAERAGASVSTLDAQTLKVLNLPELSENLRYVPGVYVSDTGQTGGLSTIFVRGGSSSYNKVQIDGVPVNEDSGSSAPFNFGVVPMGGIDRVEMVRGAETTLYGADAMTSMTQMWSANGTTRTPELRFGAEGGTFETARGFASLGGAHGRYDYNVYAEQYNTNGQGVNDEFSDSLQGANLGVQMTDTTGLRLRIRHSNSRTGVPGDWQFPAGDISPDSDAYARQNDFIGSLALTFDPTSNWQNTITGFEYNHRLRNQDSYADPGRPYYDFPYDGRDHFNRAGFDYQGEVAERAWSRSVFGFRFEDENAYISDPVNFVQSHGLRRNTALYGEQLFDWKRLTLTGGVRWEHNEAFGNHAVPRATASVLLVRGGHTLSGTRLRGSYSEGLRNPTFEQVAGTPVYGFVANPDIKPEKVQATDAGLVQTFFDRRWALSAVYFHNRFIDQINYTALPTTDPRCAGLFYCDIYLNVNHTVAQGAELELQGRMSRHLSLGGSYTYTNLQTTNTSALLRRPKQLGTALVTYNERRWGASAAGSFVGRRQDYDYFHFIPVMDAGYARFDLSGYREITHRVTAFATVQNVLNHKYQEVVGYPALKANFRAGLRFRVGGE